MERKNKEKDMSNLLKELSIKMDLKKDKTKSKKKLKEKEQSKKKPILIEKIEKKQKESEEEKLKESQDEEELEFENQRDSFPRNNILSRQGFSGLLKEENLEEPLESQVANIPRQINERDEVKSLEPSYAGNNGKYSDLGTYKTTSSYESGNEAKKPSLVESPAGLTLLRSDEPPAQTQFARQELPMDLHRWNRRFTQGPYEEEEDQKKYKLVVEKKKNKLPFEI